MGIFEQPDYSLITPNPLDYLPFDRVRLILNSAFRLSGSSNEAELQNVIEQFNLGYLSQRLIYTLSGGETLRVAMAKCALESSRLKRLIMAAPWGVLSQEGRKYLKELITVYSEPGRDYQILCLVGDTSDEPEGEIPTTEQVPFGIQLRSVEIPLSDSARSDELPFAKVEDFTSKPLFSPCLISGENGHGKSLLAKALAGAITFSGSAVMTGRSQERVRLIFQDVSNQALLTGASLDWALQYSAGAKHLNTILTNDVLHRLNKFGLGVPQEPTLLQTKIAMVAVRLAERPAGLILDEPDWGLSKYQSLAFLNAVVSLCGQEDVPLLVISHRSWFANMWRSRLSVKRLDRPDVKVGYVMQLRVCEE